MRYKNILVVVHKFRNMAHFIGIAKVDNTRRAKAFAKDIWRLHGLHESIGLDRVS